MRLAKGRNASVVSALLPGAGGEERSGLIVACPLRWEERPLGVIGIRSSAEPAQEKAIVQLLKWGGAWLYLLQLHGGEASPEIPLLDAETVRALLLCEDIDAATTAAATALSQRLGCDRVTIGLPGRKGIRLSGLSFSSHFDPRTHLIQQITAVMDETLTSNRLCQYTPATSDQESSLIQHQRLSQVTAPHSVCSMILDGREQPAGVMVLERTHPLGQSELDALVSTGPLLAALIESKRQTSGRHGRPGRVSRYRDRLLSRGWLTAAVLLLSASAALFLLSSTRYQAVGKAQLEGRIQRAVVAPFQGYIAESHFKAGNRVAAGDLLARLEDKTLQLEYRKWASQRAEYEREYRKALSALDHTEAKIVKAQIAQAEAQMALLSQQLERAGLRSPLDGVIIEGDLSQLLGAPVDRGEVLFQVAPLDQYRVAISVDERDIPDIQSGQRGQLTLSSLPGERLAFEVSHIATVAEADQSGNYFRVEADLIDTRQLESLRPGMQGIGKVDVGSANRLWVWSRRLLGWFQMTLWRWLP